jgi:hypothetical protein
LANLLYKAEQNASSCNNIISFVLCMYLFGLSLSLFFALSLSLSQPTTKVSKRADKPNESKPHQTDERTDILVSLESEKHQDHN